MRASSLSIFNACPYKFHNNVFEPDPKVMYFGTMIHFLMRNNSVKEEMLHHYSENINHDMKLERIWHKLVDNAQNFIKNIEWEKLEEFPMLYKLPFWYDDEWWLEGTADLVNITSSWNIKIYDYKTAKTSNWYNWEDIWKEQPQGKIYSFLASKLFWVNEIEFTYVVLEKANQWKISTYSKVYKIDTIEKEILDLADKYIESNIMWDYEATPCRFCNFCQFKNDWTCPAYKVEANINLPWDELDF